MLSLTIYELRGIPCMELEIAEPKQSIVTSRSFGQLTTSLPDLQQALTVYTSRACEKCRAQQSLVQWIAVFLRTNPHKENEPQREVSLQSKLAYPTQHTSIILDVAEKILQQLFKPNYRYQKIGIMLLDLIQVSELPNNFSFIPSQENKKMMDVMDSINQRFGQDTLFLASAGIKREWQMQRQFLSPRFTTQWKELLLVK